MAMQDFSFDQAFLFNTGSDFMSYNLLGSHKTCIGDAEGFSFSVWAPAAIAVSVVGDFNFWDASAYPMEKMGETGIFHTFVPSAEQWQRYKYSITTAKGEILLKADPFAVHSETRQGTSSILYNLDDGFLWSDRGLIGNRGLVHYNNPSSNKPQNIASNPEADRLLNFIGDPNSIKPLNIYEVHLGSWRQYPDGTFYNYKKMAHELAHYVKEMGYTHIELLPVMEHPLDDSWGYQVTGFYSPTSRFGTPYDFKYFVNHMHENGIGVILDWVPGHFPKDAFGLARFDGSALYEYADDRIGEHKEWGTNVFNYSRDEVRSFLISNAVYWIECYHIDGIRADAVSSMIYLNYGRTNFIRNAHGGVENLHAVSFLQQLNRIISEHYGILMIAEESTAWQKVTAPAAEGGLGFTHKWNMGWMHDTLDYFSLDYADRKAHQSKLSFSMVYAFTENFILPLSHDEVVHGKSSIIGRMPGDHWRKFASIRTLYAYMMAHPGGKMLFMGNEFSPFIEWRFREPLEWFLLEYSHHAKLQQFVKALNHLYLAQNALWDQDRDWNGFQWHSADDAQNSMFVFSRIARANGIEWDGEEDGKSGGGESERIVVVLNLTPEPKTSYPVGVMEAGEYETILNTDREEYGGSGYLSDPDSVFTARSEMIGGFPFLLEVTIPPLSVLYLKRKGDGKNGKK